jgi:hypothetical protein
MKIIFLYAVLAIAFLTLPTLARADASPTGCEHSGGQAKGCGDDPAAVPEPASSALVATGLLAIAGLAIGLRRKWLVQN